ncbi:rcc01693 family protein [Sulfitobacter noctilucicola]|uniref:Putative phage protein (TIGR02216 family) n=1 Tax=Sulfitobacter noctilucicola TaxID=1342301 RepID=A0A7W6Q787_9RHOB|nr:rcc01693 family protein [Sulfitobacter noctilucicola]MBB4175657.1 putative phage protein (TIGR02216 family) [Sulfitobacter noctilucicola]
MSGLDWPALMRVGFHGLGLKPDAFWALTPVELQVMLGSTGADKPMLSDGLAALMAAYPDKEKGTADG